MFGQWQILRHRLNLIVVPETKLPAMILRQDCFHFFDKNSRYSGCFGIL